MIVSMRPKCTEDEIKGVQGKLESLGFQYHISRGVERTIIGVIGKIYPDLKDTLELMPGVAEVVRLSRPFKLSSREFHPDDTVVRVRDVTVGGSERVVMAGPCAVAQNSSPP